mmetsp:Transcript_42551/g.131380  ORF Transcript_42551/g.131380 Transcript_42551/m.131380 type:complete len:326 (-) Transcript_42551:16-993(-)
MQQDRHGVREVTLAAALAIPFGREARAVAQRAALALENLCLEKLLRRHELLRDGRRRRGERDAVARGVAGVRFGSGGGCGVGGDGSDVADMRLVRRAAAGVRVHIRASSAARADAPGSGAGDRGGLGLGEVRAEELRRERRVVEPWRQRRHGARGDAATGWGLVHLAGLDHDDGAWLGDQPEADRRWGRGGNGVGGGGCRGLRGVSRAGGLRWWRRLVRRRRGRHRVRCVARSTALRHALTSHREGVGGVGGGGQAVGGQAARRWRQPGWGSTRKPSADWFGDAAILRNTSPEAESRRVTRAGANRYRETQKRGWAAKGPMLLHQ